MSRRRDVRRARRKYQSEKEDINPMAYVSNLVDAMLVLAVGIMLALVINWNIDVTSDESKDNANSKVPTFEDDNLQSVDESEVKDKDELEETGTVYYDPDTKTYYLLKD